MIVERPALEARVLASLDVSRIPVVLGGCGSGRTSLLLRLAELIGHERSQYLDLAAAATTPEQCLTAILQASPFKRRGQTERDAATPTPDSPRAAFDALLAFFDQAVAADGGPLTFLIDEILDVRTFESFPGLRHGQREIVARLSASPNRFVLASRFTARTHRLLRDAPARFEVVHLPPLVAHDVAAMALKFGGTRSDWGRNAAPMVTALGDGRAAHVQLILSAMAAHGSAMDPVAALASLFTSDGRLTAFCRERYEFRLHRARGYGALKAILNVLADTEPLNLTEIAQRLHRTPGSTKDYLSWLEDVDLVTVQRKRYTFEDPLLRVYVRLFGRAVPPTAHDVRREIHGYAQRRMPAAPDEVTEPVMAAVEVDTRESGIIEID